MCVCVRDWDSETEDGGEEWGGETLSLPLKVFIFISDSLLGVLLSFYFKFAHLLSVWQMVGKLPMHHPCEKISARAQTHTYRRFAPDKRDDWESQHNNTFSGKCTVTLETSVRNSEAIWNIEAWICECDVFEILTWEVHRESTQRGSVHLVVSVFSGWCQWTSSGWEHGKSRTVSCPFISLLTCMSSPRFISRNKGRFHKI